jgi:hypothetical protein
MAQILCMPPLPVTHDLTLRSDLSTMIEPLPKLEIHRGTFHLVTVAAVQNLLFMMRIASVYYLLL